MIKTFIKAEYTAYKNLLQRVPSLVITGLVLTVVSMNLLANKELIHTDWIALDCGFALSWIPFLIMDCICKVYGGKTATRISIMAIVINLIMFLIFKLLSLTPGMWGQFYSTGNIVVNEALNKTIGGSTWIVLGSALAMAVSSVINSIVNINIAKLLKKDNYQSFAIRSFSSTAVSQFVDNLIFALVVSIPLFGWNLRQALFCSLTCAGVELVLEICFSGIGYRMIKKTTAPKGQVTKEYFMNIAIEEAQKGITNGEGGPFGSVIVKNGDVIGKGHNKVIAKNDPTCHGEIAAIRDACNRLGTFDLSGCEIYTTGEPCHMCLCACLWANIDKIYYGCTIKDNNDIGFRDDKFDQIFGGRDKLKDYLVECNRHECKQLFDEYKNMQHKTY